MERRFWYPFMNWMQNHYVTPRAVQTTDRTAGTRPRRPAKRCSSLAAGCNCTPLPRTLQEAGPILRLAPGSLLGTGGGLKELYPFTPGPDPRRPGPRGADSGRRRATAARSPSATCYGMAEGNWAAMQCSAGQLSRPALDLCPDPGRGRPLPGRPRTPRAAGLL